jgi:hypothetical protein
MLRNCTRRASGASTAVAWGFAEKKTRQHKTIATRVVQFKAYAAVRRGMPGTHPVVIVHGLAKTEAPGLSHSA